MQTPSSASPAPARAPQATREAGPANSAANDRRAAKRDGAGDVRMFSELVAQAGEQVDASPAETTDTADTAGAASNPTALDVLAGLIPADLARHPLASADTRLSTVSATPMRSEAETTGQRAGGTARPDSSADATGLAAGGKLPGALAGTTGATGAADAADAGVTAALAGASGNGDGSDAVTVVRGAADSTASRVAATAAAPGNAVQAALQLALREAGAVAPDAVTATGRFNLGTAAGGLEAAGAERGLRARRAGPEGAAGLRSPAGAAGRNAATMVDGMGSSGSLTANASANATAAAMESSAATVDAPAASGAAAATFQGGGADPSVFALTMNQASTNTLAATRTDMMAQVTQASIDVPVDHTDFAEAFARQSASLVVQGSSHAEIQLNPQDMGPIRIAITMDADAASLDITAAHADTRAALESSMPALRQMLADQGVRLADWRLESQPTGERQQQTAGDGGRHNPQQSDAQQLNSRQTGGNGAGNAAGNSAGHATPNGIGEGRAGAQRHGWGPLRNDQAGGSAAGGNSRIDLYA